jgi:hypothetical protein
MPVTIGIVAVFSLQKTRFIEGVAALRLEGSELQMVTLGIFGHPISA